MVGLVRGTIGELPGLPRAVREQADGLEYPPVHDAWLHLTHDAMRQLLAALGQAALEVACAADRWAAKQVMGRTSGRRPEVYLDAAIWAACRAAVGAVRAAVDGPDGAADEHIAACGAHARRAHELAAEAVIVTRHAGLVDWLRRLGITGRVIAHATLDDVRGRRVIGPLPLHLAAHASLVGAIDMPLITAESRGRDLSPEEMDRAGAVLHWYTVRPVAGD
ncbi:MAG TPA: CRISPR-associated protein Csx16 [Phycisphaerales bacterium]|nr:CRISPR-associated protein Csx16 [Phycisphaerales bacterium]HMP37016.1 CRISPR-associated protein Csx16 [Phycisphaerales bacterium]